MSNRRLHMKGWTHSEVLENLKNSRESDFDWNDPRNLKASYFAGHDVVEVAKEAFNLYMADNAIYGASLYPSLPQLETEVIEMVLELLNAPANAAGMLTTGGTESIMLAWRFPPRHGFVSLETLASTDKTVALLDLSACYARYRKGTVI